MSKFKCEAGFAFVREAECEALKGMKPSAALAWIAIRSDLGRNGENEPFPCGSRDFKEWGLGRDAAAAALKEFVSKGLLEIVTAGSFGRRGSRSTFRIVHRRSTQAEENKAGKSANSKPVTAGKSANSGRKTRQLAEITAGFSDTSSMTSSTSSQKSKEEEVIDRFEVDPQRSEKVRAHQASIRRIDSAAAALVMKGWEFIQRSGGPKAADLLARSFERGNLTPEQLRRRLADSGAISASSRTGGMPERAIAMVEAG